MNFLMSLYGCMFLVGVLGNGSLGFVLCCGPGARSRSPLLLGLITADLLVCSLSGPVTAALYTITSWTQTWYDAALFLQTWPLCASTLSMMAISMDRYLTIKNHRAVGQEMKRRYVLATAVVITWLCAAFFSCTQLIPDNPWKKALTLTRVIVVHIIPALVVLASHLGVYSKLTAVSLTARAKHGELPLPMPLLRRPTHLIIVAAVSKSRNDLQNEKCDEDDDVTQPPTSTLRSRRRLANSLLWVSAIFAICWLPYVVCQFCLELGAPPSLETQRYSLLLSQAHSVFSPLLYWMLNYQWLHRPCKFRLPGLYRSPSSTNEAALGPFHPRYIRRPPPMRRRSSHYLY